jgi:hypothetical protein
MELLGMKWTLWRGAGLQVLCSLGDSGEPEEGARGLTCDSPAPTAASCAGPKAGRACRPRRRRRRPLPCPPRPRRRPRLRSRCRCRCRRCPPPQLPPPPPPPPVTATPGGSRSWSGAKRRASCTWHTRRPGIPSQWASRRFRATPEVKAAHSSRSRFDINWQRLRGTTL